MFSLSYAQVLFPFFESILEIKSLEELQLFHYLVQRYGIERNILPKDEELVDIDIPSDFKDVFFMLLDTFLIPQTQEDIQMIHYTLYLFAFYRGFLDEDEVSAEDRALVEEIKESLIIDFRLLLHKDMKSQVIPTGDLKGWMSRWIESWRQNRDQTKIEAVEAYKKRGIDLTKIESLEELDFYKEYLFYFDKEGMVFALPEFADMPFDWDLLFRLIAGSFSSEWELVFGEQKPRLKIIVGAEDRVVEKYLDELWEFQIERMFEIFISEQISLSKAYWDGERESVQAHRQKRIEYFENQKRKYRRYKLLTHLKKT